MTGSTARRWADGALTGYARTVQGRYGIREAVVLTVVTVHVLVLTSAGVWTLLHAVPGYAVSPLGIAAFLAVIVPFDAWFLLDMGRDAARYRNDVAPLHGPWTVQLELELTE